MPDYYLCTKSHPDSDFATDPWQGRDSIWTIEEPGDYSIRFATPRDGVAIDACVFQHVDLPDPEDTGPDESAMTPEGVFIESGGRVVAEAEHLTARWSRKSQDWLVVPGEDPGDTVHLNFRGSGYLQHLPDLSPTLAEQMAALTREAEAEPPNSFALSQRADLYKFLGQQDKALADWSKRIELAQDDENTWQKRGHELAALGRFDEALSDFTTAERHP